MTELEEKHIEHLTDKIRRLESQLETMTTCALELVEERQHHFENKLMYFGVPKDDEWTDEQLKDYYQKQIDNCKIRKSNIMRK